MLRLREQSTVNMGKYGHLRLEFLKAHRCGTYTTLLTTCKLSKHVADIDAEASQRVCELTVAFAKADGITEQLKAENNLLTRAVREQKKSFSEEVVYR